jgi:hypothetical protein
MARYIHPDNQEILWNTITQHPRMRFAIPDDRRPAWFKSHVQKVYENIPSFWHTRKITTEELNRLNQTTLRDMISDLTPPPNYPENVLSTPRTEPHTYSYTNSYSETATHGSMKSSHTPMIQQRFLEKQQEMEAMLRTPAPQTVDFRMAGLDEPIANMEELIQKHVREREKDLMQPLIPPPTSATLSVPPTSSSLRISDQEVSVPVTETIQSFPPPLPPPSSTKTVTFQEPPFTPKTFIVDQDPQEPQEDQRITLLTTEMKQLKDRVTVLEDLVRMFTTVASRSRADSPILEPPTDHSSTEEIGP